MKYLSYLALLICLLIVMGCDKRDEDKHWIHLNGFDFPVNISHFADYDNTDAEGNLLGHVNYGSGGDNNDWKVFTYHGQDRSMPSMLTGLAMPDNQSYNSVSQSASYSHAKSDFDRSFDAHGFIYPGVPETIIPDSICINLPFTFKTPSLEQVSTTPVIEYQVCRSIPIELPPEDPSYVYYYFGVNLTTASLSDHTKLSIAIPAGICASAYYNDTWHQTYLYPAYGPSEISWDNIPFADTVKVVFSAPPYMSPELDPFTSEITDDFQVHLTWVTESETDILGYNLLRSDSNDLQDAVMINDSLITRGDLPPWNQCTYNYFDATVEPNHNYYYWRQELTTYSQPHLYGPITATVPVYSFPTGYPYGVAVYPAYPNPGSGIFTTKFELLDSTEVNVLVVNKQHEVVLSSMTTQRFGKHTKQVNINDQPDGLYRVYYWFEKDNKKYYSYGDILKQTE